MANATKNKNQKPNWFRRVGAKIKETFSELKRVTWPKFGTVVKTDGFVWMTADEIEKNAALPTAFRQFWEDRNV